LAVKKIANERVAVGGEGQRLAYLAAREERIFEIDSKVGEIGAGTIGNLEIGAARENGNDVGGERTHFDVRGTLAKFEGANDGVGNDAEADTGDEWQRAKVIVGMALDGDFFIPGLLDKTKGSGTDRLAGEISSGVNGDDAQRGANEIDGKGSVRFAEVEDDRGGVESLDGREQTEGAALGRFVRGIEDEMESGSYVGGGERAAVVEAHAAAKMKDIGARVRSGPGFGEVAAEIHPIVAVEEAAKEQSVDALGLRVRGEARVELGGIAFDEQGDGRGIAVRLGAACGETGDSDEGESDQQGVAPRRSG